MSSAYILLLKLQWKAQNSAVIFASAEDRKSFKEKDERDPTV